MRRFFVLAVFAPLLAMGATAVPATAATIGLGTAMNVVNATAAAGATDAAGATAAAASAGMPTVTGSFGQSPKLHFPATAAPPRLEAKVLNRGSGPAVVKGDLLIANYLGQIWRGKVFDSSFTRPEPAGFPIGIGRVITGWDKTLVGVPIGSRVLLIIPPVDGYGKTGQSAAGIKGTDTLVFVVDVLASYNHTVAGSPTAAVEKAGLGGVTVGGKAGSVPTITVAATAAKPTAESATVLDKGTGKAVHAGVLVLQILAVDWTGKVVESTWQNGTPEADPVGDKSQPSALNPLLGIPLGSRVLLELPKNTSGTGPYALVADLIGQPRGTSTQAGG